MARWRTAGSNVVAACVAITGCDDGPVDDDGDDVICAETPTVLGDLSTMAVTGRTAADILAEVEGSYTGTLAWSSDSLAPYVGAAEPSAVMLDIAYDGGELRSIDAELVRSCPHLGPCPCEDSFEIDVTWRLASADGVLDETWVAPVVHEPRSYQLRPLGIRSPFALEDVQGSLSAASFDLAQGHTIRELVAEAELRGGAALGTLGVELATDMGSIGFGPTAEFAALRAVEDDACNAIEGEATCAAVGCTAVTGLPLNGFAPQCECGEPVSFCFAAAPEPDAPLTLYTRVASDTWEQWDEVVALPNLGEPPPSPWRACTDAPEIEGCACADAPSLCE